MIDNLYPVHPAEIKCVVFDFGFTLSPDLYFKIAPPGYPHWRDVIQKHVFDRSEIVEPWMAGDLTIIDIAGIISRYIPQVARPMDPGDKL